MPATSVQPVASALIGAFLLGDPAQITRVTADIEAGGRAGEVLETVESVLDAALERCAADKNPQVLEGIEEAVHQQLAVSLTPDRAVMVAQMLESGFPDDGLVVDPARELAAGHIVAAYIAEVYARTTPEFATEALAMLAAVETLQSS